MSKNFRLLAIFAAVILIGLSGASGQTAGDMTKDPVCGMTVKIAGAVPTAEYLGKSYYFCSDDCKTAFLKDPAKFASKKEAAAPGVVAPDCPMMKADEKPCRSMMRHGEMRMKKMHGMAMKPCMMGPGMADGCLLSGGLAGKADIVVENTADGVAVRISSKDPEAVKMIQKHAAAMKAACDPASCPKHEKAKE